ncbi:sugar transporter [Falsirhodobacter xinxiangensis]|uniref:sugar transporter n=1 Tax=Falsirhodobacter xinxiangensis TaxID=2530049 RepID=UPI001FE69AD3|nr:sugar transporter [Rhodobacter xinxiangensis]
MAQDPETPPKVARPEPAKPRPRPARPRLPTAAAAATTQFRSVVSQAKAMPRHYGILVAFAVMVILPVLASAAYLYLRAADQYASTLAFTVRSEESSGAIDLLGGLGRTLGTTSANESDVLYEFIRSQDIVQAIDAKVNLREMYARHHDSDPLMTFDSSGSIEDLRDYWRRMVRISYDSGSGLLELRVLAFDPTDARRIAEAIHDESSRMINELSTVAREDATRYARDDLDVAVERLKNARDGLTSFRVENQIVDITADLQGQTGVLASLQAQLADALVQLDLVAGSTRADDPRVVQAQRRIEVIESRIDQERQKFGNTQRGPNGTNYATVVSEFERLTVDREFAETAYTAALASYDAAVAEANRRNRYLASYIRPTLAETAEFPQRGLLVGLVALFSFLAWAIGSLVFYALRDRR